MVAAETRCKIKEIKGEMKIADTYYVNVPYGETVNVRTEPSRQSPILFTLPRGTMVTRWGTFGATDGSGDQYYGINTEDGRSGCINSSFLTTSYVDPGDPWIGTYGSTVWKKSLHSGQYHAEVQNIQRDLRKVGYTTITNADGYYGTISSQELSAQLGFDRWWLLWERNQISALEPSWSDLIEQPDFNGTGVSQNNFEALPILLPISKPQRTFKHPK